MEEEIGSLAGSNAAQSQDRGEVSIMGFNPDIPPTGAHQHRFRTSTSDIALNGPQSNERKDPLCLFSGGEKNTGYNKVYLFVQRWAEEYGA